MTNVLRRMSKCLLRLLIPLSVVFFSLYWLNAKVLKVTLRIAAEHGLQVAHEAVNVALACCLLDDVFVIVIPKKKKKVSVLTAIPHTMHYVAIIALEGSFSGTRARLVCIQLVHDNVPETPRELLVVHLGLVLALAPPPGHLIWI